MSADMRLAMERAKTLTILPESYPPKDVNLAAAFLELQGELEQERKDSHALLVEKELRNAELSGLLLAERKAREEAPKWTCFHCGFSTAEKKEAEAHFGDGDGEVALCVHWSALQKEDRLLEYQAMIRELNFARDELVTAEQEVQRLKAKYNE